MAAKKTTNQRKTKKTPTKQKTKTTGKNVQNYEIKLFILLGFTVLSLFSLHTDLIGPVGQMIKILYFGLFSYAGYTLPYILFIAVFFKLNNRLIIYRTKTIIGLLLLFLSIIFIVNILNYDVLNDQFIKPEVSLLKISSIKTLFDNGLDLSGSGVIGSLIGLTFIRLINITGLYILIATLWVISFVLITNIHLTEWLKNRVGRTKTKLKENKEIKEIAKAEYLKESEKLEAQRLKEQEKIKQIKEKELDNRSKEKMDKALSKVDQKLKAEEKMHQKALQDYDAMFSQSPTRSLVDKLLKKSEIPTADELKVQMQIKAQQEALEHEREEAFGKFDSKGYAFDDAYEADQIKSTAPDIFDNHQESSLTEADFDVPITGFGAIVQESIRKAYESSEDNYQTPEETFDSVKVNADFESVTEDPVISSFDIAFNESKQSTPIPKLVIKEDIFEDGTPLSEEEKLNVQRFDAMFGANKSTTPIESKIPDEAIVQHMSDRVRLEFENYRIPSVNILEKNVALQKENKSVVYEKAKHLESILENFNVDAKVVQISKGPAITRYEIELKPGTKMSKITNLSDDIALNLATQQVRIAAVPGKAAVGIEVPNDSTAIVRLREVLDSKEFENTNSKLSVGLGKNISGTPIVADLSKMPHLLIAGATGSGKSVCVNTLITSILLKSKPDEVKFLMIDPKVVELNNYNGIPHLILPVVTDPKKASVALNWAVQEMTRRYNEFAENGVRDISGYNKKNGEDKTLFMPQIVVIIDELADLMMVAPNQVEDAICRLAQMARAAGIHLIVATQRPSVDVITGVIKANIPSRIAFAVSSAIDSRTIIDMSGAEKLLGKGDMLYYPAGSSKPQRVQGAFISDEEVEAVVSAVKNQFDAFSYDENLLNDVGTTIQASESDDENDEYLQQAIQLVVEMEQASISMLQRKFKIGYNRAARIVDEMEAIGVVGPPMGSKPRTVLISKSDLVK